MLWTLVFTVNHGFHSLYVCVLYKSVVQPEFGVSGASDLTDSSIDDERGNDMTGSGKKWVFL
jgi:hypothetical protein